MTSSLLEFGNLVADQCILTAEKLKGDLVAAIAKTRQSSLTPVAERDIMLTLTFMSFFVASGVWSNIHNVVLRRDLMIVTKDTLIYKLASIFQKNQSYEYFAEEVLKINSDFLQPYGAFHKSRLNELDRKGIDANANSTFLVALEWIQTKQMWNDAFMTKVVPSFAKSLEVLDNLESIAYNVNKAIEQQKKKTLWVMLFGHSTRIK